MKPLTLATGIVALLVLSAWAAGLLQKPQARVLCQDSRRGYLSADMDLEDVTQTPEGWVLYFPRRAVPDPRVKRWNDAWALFEQRKAGRESLAAKSGEARHGTLAASIIATIKPNAAASVQA